MKKLVSILVIACTTHICAYNNAQALEPNRPEMLKWEQYETNRTANNSVLTDMGEVMSDLCKWVKHWFLLDMLVFKNNKIETKFAKEVLQKFDLNPKDITILHKPLELSISQAFYYALAADYHKSAKYIGSICTIGDEHPYPHGTPSVSFFNTIILDQYEFKKFSPDEQAFLLGREVIHVKNKDYLTKLLASCALNLTSLVLPALLLQCQQSHKNSSSLYLTSFVLCKLLSIPLMAYFSKWQERRCDIEAAKRLNLTAAGISVYKKMQQEYVGKREVPLNPDNFVYKLFSLFGIFFSQPPLYERIEYLQELADQQAINS